MEIVFDNNNFSIEEIRKIDLDDKNLSELISFIDEWLNDKDYIEVNTSGSTGVPKIIRLMKSDMIASATLTNDFFHLRPKSSYLLSLPISYIAGKMMFIRAFQNSGILFLEKPSSNPFRNLKSNIDMAAIVPMQFANIESGIDKVRNILIGGGSISNSLYSRILSYSDVNIYSTYGMTETASHIALCNLKNGLNLYKALGNVSFDIDERDCLIINTPHLSSKKFITNDIVKLNSPTEFEWVGRFDNIINTGGIKFSPETLESIMADYIPYPFFICGITDEILGHKIVLVIECSCDDIDIFTLKSKLRESLPKYATPKEILFVSKLIRTSSAKIKRIIPNN